MKFKKSENLKDFVEKVDSTKKLNPKDLSSDQDLSIAVMNLISIEEHLIFSGAKTGKNSFFDMVGDIREMRKGLMQMMIKEYEGEVWCISKHLLAASMRLMEVGTKQQNMGRKEIAYKLFNQAYDLYCLFWGLNMKLIDTKDVKWIQEDEKDIAAISAKLSENKALDTLRNEPTVSSDSVNPAPAAAEGESMFGKLKSTVRKIVDCCIE